MTKQRFLAKLSRVKTLDSNLLDTELDRCLNTVHLSFLGMGSMLGAGLYILTGTIARETAGPAVILSYLIAGFASVLAAFAYAEFGARVPKAGSSYVYTYVTMGEMIAFIIGWEVILEYLVGSASIARTWSGYFDTLTNHKIRDFIYDHITGGPIDVPFLAAYPDLFALLIVLIVTTFVALGANVSAKFYSTCTVVNLFIILFVFVVGMIYADPSNWSIPNAGFAPFGISGILAGAAPCFYAYVGFDAITTSGEEAKNPTRDIPRALAIALVVATLSYVSVSAALTLMVPYYDIHPDAAIPDAFKGLNLPWAEYIAGVGALFGITSALTTFTFALPRCVYAMASDGLLFTVFAKLHPKTKVPIVATIFFGIIASILAVIFDLAALVEFLSIGTLLAYTIVSACVIVLRYNPESKGMTGTYADDTHENVDAKDFGKLKKTFTFLTFLAARKPGFVPAIATPIMVIFLFLLALVIVHAENAIAHLEVWALMLLALLSILAIISLFIICIHQQNTTPLNFKVPLVPFIPALSIFINFILMVSLNYVTWIRLGIWITIGMTLYLSYGLHHSREGQKQQTTSDEIELSPEDDMPLIQERSTGVHPQQTNELTYGTDIMNHTK
ncbi:cationic amino acid transporter 4-like [Glandiceps talaboti]